MEREVLTEVSIPGVTPFCSGKVRDIYLASEELGYLLMIATDRISAFDVVLPNGIPDKGRVLNLLSAFWMEQPVIKAIVPNHLFSTDSRTCLTYLGILYHSELAETLEGRMMLIRKAERIDIECVVRGYLAGSAWAEYKESGTIFGQPFFKGLRESDELPSPTFTPTTKAASGHDEPISLAQMKEMVGETTTQELMEKSLAIYQRARDYAIKKGIIIADTKFEYGRIDGELTLIDEVLTPDSSRFWEAAIYQPGGPQPSYDKQPVRDWLTASGWNKEPPAPELPPEVVEATTQRYREAYQRLTGQGVLR